MDKALSTLNLPHGVEIQTLKLLQQIARAHTADDLFRASDRAEGRWVPVRSRRERLRTWASLTAVGRFADSVGLSGFSVEL
ncbi:hypothetical protein HKK52_11140 [Pseudomonas sp. ADAK2]|uniref:hypothetical protein n=1 Tax=unclassified Pseudomonas TaxID=196821 RepID=UPI0014631BFC|nr:MULTISPECIES: hypothetical protein [unclassified Pseudomonas]QJI39386.1 hypothetical protein HKK53_11140 [Pseudomonas sp. ADAK7]QJI45692.1 hypothetical protein HKK52_11140 [Pseudomonas sp. ADAK2]